MFNVRLPEPVAQDDEDTLVKIMNDGRRLIVSPQPISFYRTAIYNHRRSNWIR